MFNPVNHPSLFELNQDSSLNVECVCGMPYVGLKIVFVRLVHPSQRNQEDPPLDAALNFNSTQSPTLGNTRFQEFRNLLKLTILVWCGVVSAWSIVNCHHDSQIFCFENWIDDRKKQKINDEIVIQPIRNRTKQK